MLKHTLIALCLLASHTGFAADDYAAALRDWASVLEKFVDDQGRVAFAELANDRHDLDQFVGYLARISPANAPREFDTSEKIMAYHINAYNALAMHGVIEKGIPPDFDGFFRRASFFKFRKVMVGSRKTSLYDYENTVIRPLGEPRVHFALNCMVRDCPRLPRKPFVANELDRQLQTATVDFFANDKHLRIEHDKREVLVSEILRFYTKDFVESNKRQDLIEYINQYRADSVPADYKVRFIPYDWTINSQP
jgi:hypothetical protein